MALSGTPDRVALSACYGQLLMLSLSSCFAPGFWSFQSFCLSLPGSTAFYLFSFCFVLMIRRRLSALFLKLILCFCFWTKLSDCFAKRFPFLLFQTAQKLICHSAKRFFSLTFQPLKKLTYTSRSVFLFLIFQTKLMLVLPSAKRFILFLLYFFYESEHPGSNQLFRLFYAEKFIKLLPTIGHNISIYETQKSICES